MKRGDPFPAFEDIIENSPDVTSLLDDEGTFLWTSQVAAHLLGFEPDRLVGKKLRDIVHPDDRALVEAGMAELKANPEKMVALRYRFRGSDDGWRWIEARCASRIDDPSIRAIIVTARRASDEVPNRQGQAGALGEMDRQISEIHHRVKNSIAMISSLISLEEGRAEDGSLRGTLENLRFRIDSISGLYRLRLAAGNPGIIHLPAYLERLVMDLAGSLERGDVAVTLDLAELSIDVARAGPIGIICTELVVNAFRHGLGGGRAGRLLVRLAEEEGSLELSVEDDGRGLGEGFDIEEGRSLGLQLARMLSLQLKGRLDAESPAVGGARFCLRLPFQG